MTEESFQKLVKKGIKAIPEKFLKRLDNINIVIEDEPTFHQLEKLNARREQGLMILGLYEGVPQINRCCYGQVLPDKITIFKNSIEKIANGSEIKIKEIVKNTVWHEIAHHFGMDEREIRAAEHRRLKTKLNKIK